MSYLLIKVIVLLHVVWTDVTLIISVKNNIFFM